MAAKKPKSSVYNNANKVLNSDIDGAKIAPKVKKYGRETADAKTFSSKIKTTNKKKKLCLLWEHFYRKKSKVLMDWDSNHP